MGKQISLFLLFFLKKLLIRFHSWFLSINRSTYYGELSNNTICGVVWLISKDYLLLRFNNFCCLRINREIIFLQMDECIMEIGWTMSCMAKESTLGTMEINMKENIRMIKNMSNIWFYLKNCLIHILNVMIRDSVFILGLKAKNMKVNGQTENNMEKESTFTWMVQSKQEYGKMENVPNR